MNYKEKVIALLKSQELSKEQKEKLEIIFPELKESEDEKIRKSIYNYINVTLDDNESEEKEKWLAWLEKQQSVKEIVERCKNSWYNEGKIAGMAEGLTDDEKYQQGWHDAIEKQEKLPEGCVRKQVAEAKEALFDNEDERIRKWIIGVLSTYEHDRDLRNAAIAWLEKQGDKSVHIDIESMVSSYEQRLESQGGIENSPLVNMCLTAFRRGVENTLEELNLKNLEKQGEQKVSYTTTVKTGDGGINALVTRDIDIPFGAKDSELQEATYYIPHGYYAQIESDKVVIKKGEKPTAWSEEDERILNGLISSLVRIGANTRTDSTSINYTFPREINWLKSIKQRIRG